MKHAKSNTNVVKKNNIENKRKTNLFMKSTGTYNFNTIKTSNLDRKKNYLISLLGRKNPKNLNLNKFDLNYKKNNNFNNKKEINLTTGIDNLNKKKENKNIPLQRNINIRLNLNSEIINNNLGNYCHSTKNHNYHKIMSNINLNEKIKEKDKLITKLQTELLQLQEFLSQLQKDKQNELYLTYNTIKSIDKSNNDSLSAFLNTPSILKFNKGNLKIRKDSIKRKKTPFYLNSGFNTAKESFKVKHNFIRSFSTSSSPRMFFPHKLDNVDSYNNNFPLRNIKRKKEKNLRINYNSNPNILLKKNNQFPSPKFYFTRQLSYSNYNYANNNNINNSKNIYNSNLVEKCEKLKKRMKIVLNKYNILIINIAEIKNNKYYYNNYNI